MYTRLSSSISSADVPLLDVLSSTRGGGVSSGSGPPVPGSLIAVMSDDAAVDAGFSAAPMSSGGMAAPAFERGRAMMRIGSQMLDVSSLQATQPTDSFVRSALAIVGALALGPFGICYLSTKLTLVAVGQLALVRSIGGETRALGPGWHLISTVGCDTLKFSVTDPLISFGPLTIARVLPGHVGLSQLNGQPLLLSPGVHLVSASAKRTMRESALALLR